MSEQMREKFEAWAMKQAESMRYSFPAGAVELNGLGDYAIVWVQGAWLGWQASRAELCVELPKLTRPEEPEDAFDDSWLDGYSAADRYRTKCREAIHAAGVKTK
jgi:hypothetical protein